MTIEARRQPDLLHHLPRMKLGLTLTRRWTGFGLACIGLPTLTALLVSGRDTLSLATDLVLYLLAVVLVSVVGGVWPALATAVVSFLLANWFLTTPYHTFHIEERDSVVALLVFVTVAVVVSVTVEVGANRRVAAVRARFEADVLSRFTAEPLSETSLTGALQRVRDLYGMDSVALIRDDESGRTHVLGRVGAATAERSLVVDIGGMTRLEAAGPRVFAEDRTLLKRLAETAVRAYEGEQLAEQAARTAQLAEVDRLRSALLAAVGHDLRTPLSAVKSSVSSLRQTDVEWSPEEEAELLATIESGADRLDALISNLLAMSRLQAGALIAEARDVALDEVVGRTLLHVGADGLEVDVPDDLPHVLADAGLLERVVANLVDNARRFSPVRTQVQISGRAGEDSVVLTVVDHGRGVPEEDWDRMFTPFQRLGDHSGEGSVGLGLAIARGFTQAMGGTVSPSHTPGGGLTMSVTLPVAWPAS